MDYKITNVQRRNEWKSSYQKDMVTYAISLEGESGWVELNQLLATPPPEIGATIHGNIENITTPNGTPVRKFKKVNPEFQDRQQQQTQASPQMNYIVQMLEELTGRKPAYEQKDVVIEDVPDGPINLNDLPF